MSDLIVISKPEHDHANGAHAHIHVEVDRLTLAKRRWRGVAEDGREFGFDLEQPLEHGDHFYGEGDRYYAIEQTAETVLEIPVANSEQAARVAWGLGNLHFGVQVLQGAIRVPEDSAVIQFLQREHIAYRKVSCVFQPLSTGASHHHHHDHGHHHG
jgi:urease accessory protein